MALIPLLDVAALQPGAIQSNPSAILHIAVFVTLCEAYIGIDPYIELTILGAWLFTSGPGMMLTLISTSPYPNR
jgi:hypothetical protein